MQYKNNVLDKISNLDAVVMRLQIQVNRNTSKDEVLDTIESLKEQIESVREMISLERDEFENQFR